VWAFFESISGQQSRGCDLIYAQQALTADGATACVSCSLFLASLNVIAHRS
jgi:hypothetical protein